MPVIKIHVIIAILVVSLLQDCHNPTPPEYQKLFRLPVEQQAVEFRKYPLEQQIDVYIEAMEGVEPPATQFGSFLASNRGKVIPLLLARLKKETNDRRRYYLIAVFEQMHTEYCSLKDQQMILRALEETISLMKDSGYKELCEMDLKGIRARPGVNARCA
jgi:hypothetical protein